MEHAYAAIGRAVFAAQLFETIFVVCFEAFKMHTEPGYLEKTGGYITAGALKIPIKAIVNNLSTKASIAPDLEQRLTAYTEDRNLLIHRWFQKHGWPADNDADEFAPIVELANRVEMEAKDFARQFADYMVKFAYPELTTSHADEYKARMANIFIRGHLGGQPW
jgi:hypothetical protein